MLLAFIASGCGNAAEPSGEPVAQSTQALCRIGLPCTGYNGGCSGTGTCNASGVCVVSVWCSDGDPCTFDQCFTNIITGIKSCINTGTTGGACNDGNACTQTDTCQNGVCTGSNPKVCTATDQCHVAGTCNTSTGVCSNPVKANGTYCNDGNGCTQTDTCQNGTCSGSNPVYCSDPCKTCNTSDGTCTIPAADWTPCDDGDECIGPDSCWAGTCYGQYDVECTASDQCHNAGVCDSYSGQCSNPIKTNGTSCNYDSNACTPNDSCQNGVCTAGAAVVCPTPDQCHVAGVCNTSTGVCTNPTKTNGTGCDDSNACTQTDTCQNGTCTGSNPKTCTASDQCHDVGTCNTSTGVCSNPAKTNGTSCTDGNACTTADTCQSGTCTGGPAPNCNDNNACTADGCSTTSGCTHTTISCDDGNACTIDGCNTSTGCTHTFASTATACDDNKYCTRSDHCDGAGHCTGADNCEDADLCTEDGCAADGSCYHVNTVVCNGQNQCQQAGYCDGNTGACVYPSKPDGTACDDNLRCTNNDACLGGACHGTAVVCTASNQCHDVGTCDPSNGSCSDPVKPNGTDCDDQNHCSLTSSCQSGTCTGANWITCPEEDCRYAGTCEPSSGNCIKANKPAGTSCTDSNKCNENDQCDGNGNCSGSGTKVCDDGNPCTQDFCYPYQGCINNPAPPETACDDHDACTTIDHCQDGTCIGTAPKTCTALDQCHVAGTCDPGNGLCSNPLNADGTLCDYDSSQCTQNDSCQAGVCTAGPVVTCTGTNQCKTCDPATGTCSVQKPSGTFCDDANACTQTDTCQAGVCIGDDPVYCFGAEQCKTCDPTKGTCSIDKPNGTDCYDYNACTQTDKCENGTCVGSNPVVCTASDQCHEPGTCNPAATSGACSNPEKANGTGCNDSNACTLEDACQGGVCTGTPVVCTALNQCHYPGVCDPSTGSCSNPAYMDGHPCTDSNACTQTDQCQAGTCVGGSPVQCPDDGNVCTAEMCETSSGNCIHPPQPNTQGCDDGNACTSADTCTGAGTCAGVAVNPSDGNPCTDDSCNPNSGVSHFPLPSGTRCPDGNAENGDEICDSDHHCVEGTMGDVVVPYDKDVIERRLGTGRHPVASGPDGMAVAFIEVPDGMPPRIGVATFSQFGKRKGWGVISPAMFEAGPVVAGLPDGTFALAYTALNEDDAGDGAAIVLRTVSAAGVIGSKKVFANDMKTAGQRAPDMVWANDRLVVAWEDESIPGERRVCVREFSAELAPIGNTWCDDEHATASSVSLAASMNGYALAWRKEVEQGGSIEVKVVPGGRRTFPLYEVTPPGPPAIAAVGTGDWMVVYTLGCGEQKGAIIDSAGGLRSQTWLSFGSPERYEPSLAVTQDGVYLSFRTPAEMVGEEWDPNLDELHVERHVWAAGVWGSSMPVTLPVGTTLRKGDQANAALAPVDITLGGALFAAWDDLNANVVGRCKHGDVLVGLIATPVNR